MASGCREVMEVAADRRARRTHQTAWGADAEYSRDHWIVRSEMVWSRWRVPLRGVMRRGGRRRRPGRVGRRTLRLTPRIFAGRALDHLGFSKISTDTRGALVTWDAPVNPRRGCRRLLPAAQPRRARDRRPVQRPRRRAASERPNLPCGAAGVLVLMACQQRAASARAFASITRGRVGDAGSNEPRCWESVTILSLALLMPAVPTGEPRARASANGAIRGTRGAAERCPPNRSRRRERRRPRHAGGARHRRTGGAASSISIRRRAAPSTPVKNGARASISATRPSCRTCWRSSPGTIVDFPNNDQTYHNVFSLSKERAASISAATRRADSKSVRFDRPGIVRVFCDIHSHMSAFILVFAHRYFAVTDENGRFRIDNVPPGQLQRGGVERVRRPRTRARSSSRIAAAMSS